MKSLDLFVRLPAGFLDAMVEAVELDDGVSERTASSPAVRRVPLERWGLTRRHKTQALRQLAEGRRIDYYHKGRYGPLGTRDAFLKRLARTETTVRRFP